MEAAYNRRTECAIISQKKDTYLRNSIITQRNRHTFVALSTCVIARLSVVSCLCFCWLGNRSRDARRVA